MSDLAGADGRRRCIRSDATSDEIARSLGSLWQRFSGQRPKSTSVEIERESRQMRDRRGRADAEAEDPDETTDDPRLSPAGLKHNATTCHSSDHRKASGGLHRQARQGGEDLHSDLPLRPAAGALLGTLAPPLGVEPSSRSRSHLRRHPTAVTITGSLVVGGALVVGLWGKRADFAAALGLAPVWILAAAIASPRRLAGRAQRGVARVRGRGGRQRQPAHGSTGRRASATSATPSTASSGSRCGSPRCAVPRPSIARHPPS